MVPEFGVHLALQFLPLQIITDVRAISLNARSVATRAHVRWGMHLYTGHLRAHGRHVAAPGNDERCVCSKEQIYTVRCMRRRASVVNLAAGDEPDKRIVSYP